MAIKGRQTIRKSGGKRVRLWELETRPGTIIERLERSYVNSKGVGHVNRLLSA
jgi:hypothetical protein